MAIRQLEGVEAWSRAARHKHAQWRHSADDYAGRTHAVHYAPKFRIAATDRIFCIGSCFARNIEDQLIVRGMAVLSRGLPSPRSEWPGPAGGLVNKFTTHSMLNELSWAQSPPLYDESFLCRVGEGWRDLQLCPGTTPLTLERALERRRHLSQAYFSRLHDADVVVITLGLNEVWRDGWSDLFLNAPPPLSVAHREPGRYTLHVTGVDENVDALRAARTRIRQMRPEARVVLTVSPVPLNLTFTGEDAAVANSRSKSVLRAAADVLASEHEDVDYYPSYEMITLAPRALAFGRDCLHVADAAAGEATAAFLAAHGLPCEPLEPGFSELAYAAANPDVEAAIRAGAFPNGFAHWISYGKAEGRRLWPEPDALAPRGQRKDAFELLGR